MKQNKNKIIPKELQPFLWSKSIKKLDIRTDKNYIIHQILSYGDIKQIKWLLRAYGQNEVKRVFVKFPQKIYQPAVFHFVKNFILGLKSKKLKKQDYAKNLF